MTAARRAIALLTSRVWSCWICGAPVSDSLRRCPIVH